MLHVCRQTGKEATSAAAATTAMAAMAATAETVVPLGGHCGDVSSGGGDNSGGSIPNDGHCGGETPSDRASTTKTAHWEIYQNAGGIVRQVN